MSMESTVCDLCGADDYVVLFQGKDRMHHLPGVFPVVQCRRCRLVYLNPRPDSDTLCDYYPQTYSPYGPDVGMMGRVRFLLRKLETRRIGRLVSAGERVLEIGCASGDFLVRLRDDLGLDVAGIEMSPYAANSAHERYGLEVHAGTVFDAPFCPGSFNAVVMRHVIEHFPSASQALRGIASLLKPGGLVYLITPNCDCIDRRLFGRFWHDYDTPRHMAVFSVATLEKLLTDSGFEIREVSHSLVPNSWIYSTKNLLEERFRWFGPARWLALNNPMALALFLPLSVAQKLFRKSGRIRVIAVKK